MKACPSCGRLYPDEAGFCPIDGQGLRGVTQVPVQASDDHRVGTLVAMRYQIRRVVADGGMGRVYEALDTQAKRRVAVKMLHDHVANDDVAVERFKREFEVSKELPHDHIVEVYDFRQDAGTYALVMEFLDGEELRTVLKREKTISPGRVVRMVSQIAIGLAPAHARHFIHRDLKPDNVFLCGTREGDRVKLLDFGSVKDKSEGAKKLTVLGTTIGSPYYMAPEQAQGLDTLDQRADVWAVAAIAYESLAGTVPFLGSNGPTILLAILTKQPTPISVAGAGAALPPPPTLDAVMDGAFVKAPAGRIATMIEFADKLGRAYGLRGGAAEWAVTPQHVLDEQIREALPSLAATAPAISPSFAASVSDPFAHAGGALDAAFANAPTDDPGPGAGPSRALASAHRTDLDSAHPAGMPSSSTKWVLPVAVGAVFLVVGVVAAFLFR